MRVVTVLKTMDGSDVTEDDDDDDGLGWATIRRSNRIAAVEGSSVIERTVG